MTNDDETKTAPAVDVAALQRLAEAATHIDTLTLARYEHGGGRLADFNDGSRKLVADFYDEANREYYYAANPQAVLALLDGLRESGLGWTQAIVERDAARALLARIYQWDVMGTTDDGGYWKLEILKLLDGAKVTP